MPDRRDFLRSLGKAVSASLIPNAVAVLVNDNAAAAQDASAAKARITSASPSCRTTAREWA